MKKAINLLLAGLCVVFFAACDPQEVKPNDEETENPDGSNTGEKPEAEFPYVAEFPIECGKSAESSSRRVLRSV